MSFGFYDKFFLLEALMVRKDRASGALGSDVAKQLNQTFV
jgi:hypothetical protein